MKTAIICLALFGSTHLAAIEIQPGLSPTISRDEPTTIAFRFIRGHKQGKAHSLQWGMVSNKGIERFEVQSTYEDPTDPYSNWVVVGNFNQANLSIYKFTDRSVLPGIINYRIVAVLKDNQGTVTSELYTAIIE